MSQNSETDSDQQQNPLLHTPQSKNPFDRTDASPFSRSIAKHLSPLHTSNGHPLNFFAGPLQNPICTPKDLSKSFCSPSPFLPDRPLSFNKHPRSVQKLDFSALKPSIMQLNAMQMAVLIVHQQENSEPAPKPRPRKRPRESGCKRVSCNCQKSRCLKLYCDCFAAGQYCQNCNCLNCQNTVDFQTVRRQAIAFTLDRNPNAFKPKIKTSSRNGETSAQHNRGCNCSKSACLKKYCECFSSGVKCWENCRCTGCKNFDENRVVKKRSERVFN